MSTVATIRAFFRVVQTVIALQSGNDVAQITMSDRATTDEVKAELTRLIEVTGRDRELVLSNLQVFACRRGSRDEAFAFLLGSPGIVDHPSIVKNAKRMARLVDALRGVHEWDSFFVNMLMQYQPQPVPPRSFVQAHGTSAGITAGSSGLMSMADNPFGPSVTDQSRQESGMESFEEEDGAASSGIAAETIGSAADWAESAAEWADTYTS